MIDVMAQGNLSNLGLECNLYAGSLHNCWNRLTSSALISQKVSLLKRAMEKTFGVAVACQVTIFLSLSV
uniref:Uncharacterized protein n=1 Tax=Rhizophora mucronata TaxID=61149 RepID=A0A2P2J4S1_RHIMU